MKISIFTTTTNPIERQDPYLEAMRSYNDLADEIIEIDGDVKEKYENLNEKHKIIGYEWPEVFKWDFIGQQFNRGYEACSGDWVIHTDLDYIFHEDDMDRIKNYLNDHKDELAVSFLKKQFLLVDRFNIKARVVIAVNKAKYGQDIKFNAGGDLCQPSFKGVEIKPDQALQSGIPFYNYDFCFKQLHVIEKDWIRFDRAWHDQFGGSIGTFKGLMTGRFSGRSWEKIDIDQHPKYIRDKVKNIKPDMFGYNMFGWIKEKAY